LTDRNKRKVFIANGYTVIDIKCQQTPAIEGKTQRECYIFLHVGALSYLLIATILETVEGEAPVKIMNFDSMK